MFLPSIIVGSRTDSLRSTPGRTATWKESHERPKKKSSSGITETRKMSIEQYK